MTDLELEQWADSEHQLRIKDLSIRTADGLKSAQQNAEARRKLAGLSINQAARAVSDAGARRRMAAAEIGNDQA